MTNLLNTTVIYFSGTSISLGDSTIALESKDFVASSQKQKNNKEEKEKRNEKKSITKLPVQTTHQIPTPGT